MLSPQTLQHHVDYNSTWITDSKLLSVVEEISCNKKLGNRAKGQLDALYSKVVFVDSWSGLH